MSLFAGLRLFIFGATVVNSAPMLDLMVNSGNSNGNNFYSINVNNEQWLQSGQLEAYMNNQWYTSNSTTAKNSMDYELMQLISSSKVTDRYDDFGGGYTEQIYEWQAGDTIFQTNFKIYNDGRAISFLQYFPNGAKGTNYITATPNSGCGWGESVPPFVSFPSFNVNNMTLQKYAKNELGYLTWTSTMSPAKWGQTPVSTSNLAGLEGGPVVLYDNTSVNAIVVSTNDNFAVSTQTNIVNSVSATAMYMYDKDRNDSLLCISSSCYSANSAYTNRVSEGSGSTSGGNPEMIPLTLWYSDKYQDNYVATTSGPPDSTYTITFNNGYIFKNNNQEGTLLSLDLYYNQAKQDHATVATESLKKQLISEGYTLIGAQGYIANVTGSSNNDWRIGISSEVLEVPAGFKHETVVVVGSGINDVMLREWSKRLTSLYHTNRVDGEKDVVTSYLGYWTDNGAYYYGDSWGATTNPLNLTCCSLSVFKEVKKHLDDQQIPIQYWQMDDWWYIGLHPNEYIHGDYWSGVKSVAHWEPPATYYPGGLKALTEAIQVPLLLYGPYFAPDNDWIGQYSFIPEGAGFVLPTPEDSYGFYSSLFDFGLNATTSSVPNTGMAGYEVDFMSCLSGTPLFRMNIGKRQQWLDGMNKAAEERGIPIQYCMAIPMDLMQSLPLSQVTNGRASGDYASGGNWDIGPGSIFWSALDLKPSKDNFWTYIEEPVDPKNHPSGSDHNTTELHAMIAIFSLGPVGISDRSNYSNATLINRLCRADGRLLQPTRPITAMDDQFIMDIFNKESINIWSTDMGTYEEVNSNVNIYGHIVLAVNMEQSYDLKYNSFSPSLNTNFQLIIRNWHNYRNCVNGSLAVKSNCIQLVSANSKSLYTLTPQIVVPPMHESYELIHVIPDVSTSSIVFLGELNKYVSISQHRFSNLIIEGMSLSVMVRGKSNEIVYVSVLKPSSTGNDWNFYTFNVVVGSDGKTQFNM